MSAWKCPYCRDVIDYGGASETGSVKALVGAVKDAVADARRHLAVCDEFAATAADVLVTETEAWLRSCCDFTRRTTGGVTYRCRNTGCTGRHYMVREVPS